jgi:hypothetical protein
MEGPPIGALREAVARRIAPATPAGPGRNGRYRDAALAGELTAAAARSAGPLFGSPGYSDARAR